MKLEFLLKASTLFAKEIYKVVSKISESKNKILKINDKNIESGLIIHFNKIAKFSEEISFRELNKPKALSSVYIPLDLSLNLSSKILDESNSVETNLRNASEIIEETISETSNNIVIVGALGTGKTTLLKFICQKLLTDENFLVNSAKYPLLIRFREDELLINPDIPLFEYILSLYGIIVENNKSSLGEKEERIQLNNFKKQTCLTLLNLQNPLLLLDGIDEVSLESVKYKILANIEEISLGAPKARFILTTRKGDDDFHIQNCQQFEVAPLSNNQIQEFSEKWLGVKKALSFLKKLQTSSMYESATRPLALSHLCAIYEREGKIPEKSKSLYRKVVNLLIQDWNAENSIHKDSIFSNFDPDRKREFIESLAYELSLNFNKYQFSSSDLEKCYYNIYHKFSLPVDQLRKVINEIQVHNGLIIQSGYDRFEFAHKSFQEFLSADYLVKLPKIPNSLFLIKVPNELAVAVALSSDSTEYFSCLIEELMTNSDFNFHFVRIFINRINYEKPDFTESLQLSFILLLMYEKLIKQWEVSEASKYANANNKQLVHLSIENIDNIILSLNWSTGISLSLRNYLVNEVYNTNEILIYEIRFVKIFINTDRTIGKFNLHGQQVKSLEISKTLFLALTEVR